MKKYFNLLLLSIMFIIFLLPTVAFSQFPNIEVTVNNNPSDEYLFLGLTKSGIGKLWIVDNDLTPVFYRTITGTIFDFKYQPNGELTYNIYSVWSYGMDSSGTLNNQFFTPQPYALDIHDLQVLPDSSYYILGRDHLTIDMSQYVPGGDTAALLVAHTIHHMDKNDNEIWRWESFDHYDILDVDEHIDLTQHQIDWTHCNSIELDYDGNILLSTRNFNEITKINRQTGDIIWRLGGERNQFEFINDTRRFSRQHDARKTSAGNLILFDNGHFSTPAYSSIVEYQLDEDSLKATLIRRYSRNQSVFTQSRGGVQELPNGNTLISWGESQNPCITEINEQDSIVFEARFPSFTHQYRAYRFPWETNYIFVNTDSLNFGIVSVGDSSAQNLWLVNRKNTDVLINEFYFKDSLFFVLNSLPINVAPNDSVEITVYFKPYTDGVFTDKLNIRYSSDTLLIGRQVKLFGETPLVTVEEENFTPGEFSLEQNFPNPFNPSTIIKFSVPQDERRERRKVTLKVYDVLGNEIKTLVNENKTPGNYEVDFNADYLPSGVYFYKLQAGDFVITKKMILLK